MLRQVQHHAGPAVPLQQIRKMFLRRRIGRVDAIYYYGRLGQSDRSSLRPEDGDTSANLDVRREAARPIPGRVRDLFQLDVVCDGSRIRRASF